MNNTERTAANLVAGYLSPATQAAFSAKSKATKLDRKTLDTVSAALADRASVRTLEEARQHVQRLYILADD